MAGAQRNRVIIQDFRPFPDSLEWKVGQHYYQDRGNKGFIVDSLPIPFLVNNDGNLSSKAAALVFTALETSEHEGNLEERVVVLELGIGVGLFARFFLDCFRDLCVSSGKDYYERLCYVAGDRSEKMLCDACRHGTFANHPGHYVLRVIDACAPMTDVIDDLVFEGSLGRPIRAVFLNYILDCLPATVLEISEQDVRQLYIRSYLARGVELNDYTHMNLDEVVRLANGDDPGSLSELIPLYGLFASEYDYMRVEPKSLPFAEVAVELARGRARYFLHNHGAVECLARLHALLTDDGFILINDYGHTKMEDAQESFEPQRFSGTSAVGLNFSLIPECLKRLGILGWVESIEDDDRLISRLLVKAPGSGVISCFQDLLSKRASLRVQGPAMEARAFVEQGRYELATGFYEKALREQPWNWALMNEVAKFLTFALRDPEAGLTLNKRALALNPTCSSDLWSSLGDCMHMLGRRRDGQKALLRALRVNPGDPQVRFNLAVSYACEKDFPAALRAIADGLSVDRTGYYTQALLKLQADTLGYLKHRHEVEAHVQIDRISRALDRKNAIPPEQGSDLSKGKPD